MASSYVGTEDPNAVLILSHQLLPTEAPKSTFKAPECFQAPTSDIAGQYHVWIQVTCVETWGFFLLLCICAYTHMPHVYRCPGRPGDSPLELEL